MCRGPQGDRRPFRLALAALCVVLLPTAPRAQIRPEPAALADAAADLLDRLRTDSFAYFRFVNRPWTSRVCDVFADVQDAPIVRLHGDAHLEQFAFTKDAWGLDDFDDSSRGPSFIDIVRFLGSIELATRQRGWTRDRDAIWDRFFEGYRTGLSSPDRRPPEPGIVRELRSQAPTTRLAYLAWGEKQMQPMDATQLKLAADGMQALDREVRRKHPDLSSAYFAVKRAGLLRVGVGSAVKRKALIRVEGPTSDPDDDVLLELKEVTNLDGVRCLERSTDPPAVRVIDGTLQLGRLKHDILAVGPTMLIPAAAGRAERWLDWWVTSWEPSYREVHVNDLRSVKDLADITFDSGFQLGAGKIASVRGQALSSSMRLESRLRKETAILIEELLAGWRELRGR